METNGGALLGMLTTVGADQEAGQCTSAIEKLRICSLLFGPQLRNSPSMRWDIFTGEQSGRSLPILIDQGCTHQKYGFFMNGDDGFRFLELWGEPNSAFLGQW